MLSQKNIDKLVMTGLYSHDPDPRYRSSIYWDNMYWCYNWTFRVKRVGDDYFMVDTYFGNSSIDLTDENFDEFEFLFDFNEVTEFHGQHISDYNEEDWWHVAIDSGGMYCGGKYFIRNGAQRNKAAVIERIGHDIYRLEQDLQYKKDILKKVEEDSINLDYV